MSVTPIACLSVLCLLAPVELRSGDTIDAPIESVSPAGVTLGGLQGRVLGWDRVARVTGEMQNQARAYQEFAVDAWRARSRLARGDVTLASPVFERLYEGELLGPTGLLIAEGTMRCRLDSDPRGAAEAWLQSLVLRAQGARIDGEPVAAGFTDQVTGLVPTLPPIFLDGEPADEPVSVVGDNRADMYAALYAVAMGDEITDELRTDSQDPAIEFVRLIVLAQFGEAKERDAARTVLENQRDPSDASSWRDAWRLGAIGRALVKSDNAAQQLRGVFTLIEIAARWGVSQPHLSAVALHDAAEALDALQRIEEADVLREELSTTYPDHPASKAQGPSSDTTQEPT